MDLRVELDKTKPDFVLYVPRSIDGAIHDTGNEEVHVWQHVDGQLCAVWTQSTSEGEPDQRVVFARSTDGGYTWTAPAVIAGPEGHPGMASWGFPLVSRSGRIYVLYNRHVGINDIFTHTTGRLAGIYSDDEGTAWSAEQRIPMPRSRWDHPDPAVPPNWVVWQKPERLAAGKYLGGFTRWVSPAVRPPAPLNIWWANAAVVELMRFENLDEDPAPADLDIRWLAGDNQALQIGLIGHPEVSVAQEPSLAQLPDGRLFCVMRTTTGNPWYTVSDDAGLTWRPPQPLRQTDAGPPLLHPCSPCPIYSLADGEYVLLIHNHNGHYGSWGPADTLHHRRPVCLVHGQYRPRARQPVWFSEPVTLMDHSGVPILGRADLSMYASVTTDPDGLVLWYPDRKFFLLGKKIRRDTLARLPVPV